MSDVNCPTPTATFAYDPLGRLRQSSAGGATTDFLYDGDRLVAEYNGTTLLRRYAHGPGVDEPVVWYQGTTLTDRRWLLADRQGSIIAAVDSAGALVGSRYRYSPYGEPDADNGWSAAASRFRYTGQIALPEAQLYHYKARVYDPGLGRFLQTDPVGYEADFNLYAYVANDPLNRTDPTGLCDTFVNCLTGGTFDNGDGTVTVESSIILRTLVPGQVQWDAARTDWANGNELEAVGHAGLMVAEQVATVATLGTGTAATQGTRATAGEITTLRPGPYAGESTAVNPGRLTAAQQREVNAAGAQSGCHT